MHKHIALGIIGLLAFSMTFFPGMVIDGYAKNNKHLCKLDEDIRKLFKLGIRFVGALLFIIALVIIIAVK